MNLKDKRNLIRFLLVKLYKKRDCDVKDKSHSSPPGCLCFDSAGLCGRLTIFHVRSYSIAENSALLISGFRENNKKKAVLGQSVHFLCLVSVYAQNITFIVPCFFVFEKVLCVTNELLGCFFFQFTTVLNVGNMKCSCSICRVTR